MKTFIVLALFAAVAFAAPPTYNGDDKHAETRLYQHDVKVFGYDTKVETSNGLTKSEQGELTNQGTDKEAFVVRGAYSYVDAATGQVYRVTYTADENGFHPVGDHIPQ